MIKFSITLFFTLAALLSLPALAVPFDAGFTHTPPTGAGDYTVTWQSAYDSAPYYLQYSSDGISWRPIPSANGSAVESQKGFGSHHYRIAEVAGVLTTDIVIPVHMELSIPHFITISADIPEGLLVPMDVTQNRTITWQSVVGANTYVLEQQIDGGDWEPVYTGNGLSWDMPNIYLPGNYSYRIKACFNSICSDVSATESTAIVQANPMPFAMPDHDPTVGAIGAHSQVGLDGSANYSIPLTIPLGRFGMQPELTLSYNSNGGIGLLGVGWSVGGASVIHRCPATLERDGKIDGVDFDTLDKFCLDGQRLVAGTGNEYFLENSAYTKILSSGSLNGAPQSFTVYSRDGKISYYGSTEDSRSEVQGVSSDYTNLWLLTRVIDRHGNMMTYDYNEDVVNGSSQLSRIRYTGLLSSLDFGNKSVEFDYLPRTDKQYGYLAGAKTNLLERLEKIRVLANDIEIASYGLTYEQRGAASLSILTEIEYCKLATCLDPTVVSWQPSTTGFVSSFHALSNTSYGSENYTWFADFNGDGLADVASASAGNTYMKLSTGSGFTTENWTVGGTWGPDTTTWTGDFNGDGLPDIASRSGPDVYMRINTGSGFTADTWQVPGDWGDTDKTWAADFNGDGRTDIATANGANVFMKLSTGTGFQERTWVVANQWGTFGQWVGEFNGDGKADIASVHSDGTVYMKLSNHQGAVASGFDSATWGGATTWGNINFTQTGDFNGDGLTDFASRQGGSVFMKLATGTTFVAETWSASGTWGAAEFTWASDFNGDGLTDFGTRVNNSVHMKLSTGFGFSADTWNTTGTWPEGKYIGLGDFNGDGSLDIGATRVGTTIGVHQNQSTPSLRVTSVDNAAGMVTTFKYKPITDSSVYTAGDTALYPVVDQLGAIYVVDKLEKSDGVGGTFDTSYSYEALQLQFRGLGGVGFKSMVTLNEETGIATKTTFNQDYQLRTYGSVDSLETVVNDMAAVNYDANLAHSDWSSWVSNGVVLSITDNEWRTCMWIPGYGCHQASTLSYDVNGDMTNIHSFPDLAWDGRHFWRQLENTEITKRDLNGDFLSRETNAYTYDGYENIKTVTTRLYDEFDVLAREKIATHNYKNNGGSNISKIYGQVSDTKVDVTVTGKPTLTRKTVWEYHNTNHRKTFEKIVHPITGLVLSQTNYSSFDSYGNHLTELVSGSNFQPRTMSYTYTSDGHHIRTRTNALTQTTTYTYYGYTDDIFVGGHINTGLLETVTDPNGIITRYVYDVFGREVERTSYSGTAKEVRSYARFEPCSTAAGVVCEDKYDQNSTLVASPNYRITRYRDGDVGTHTFVDALGREVAQAAQGLDGRFVKTANGYDHRGHQTSACEPHYIGEQEYVTEMDYDVLGRPIESRTPFPDSNDPSQTIQVVDTVSYSGLIKTYTNDVGVGRKNQQKIVHVDIAGNTDQIIDNLGAAILYEYDSLGQLTMVVAPDVVSGDLDASSTLSVDHNVTTITYDDLGRKSTMDDPDKGLWEYTYNSLGLLVSQTSANGDTVCMAYDKLGRMTERFDGYEGDTGSPSDPFGAITNATAQCSSPGSSSQLSEWVYDTGIGKGKGQPHYARSYAGSTSTSALLIEKESEYDVIYGYSSSGIVRIDGESYRTDIVYDDLHRPETATYPGESNRLAVTTTYNALGFPVSVKEDGASIPYYQWLEMDAFGNRTRERLGNGVQTLSDYDERNSRIKSIQSFRIFDFSGPTIQDLSFKFDVLGNMDERHDDIQNIHEVFEYDDLNRLKSIDLDMGNGDTQISTIKYDSLGNIREKEGVGKYLYGGSCTIEGEVIQSGPHAVTKVTPLITGDKNTNYCYDNNGNMVSGDNRTTQYTVFDKPEFISKNNGVNTTQLSYGPDRARYRRVDTINGQVTTYTYAGAYEKVETSGQLEERHYIGDFAIVTIENRDEILPGTESIKYMHKDHLGSLTMITDEFATILNKFSYDPWGKRRAPSLADLEASVNADWTAMTPHQKWNVSVSELLLGSSVTNRGFTGHEQMDGVGLIHMNGRVYDAQLGRFLSADPFVQDPSNLQGLNRYTYVGNNPLSYTDPTGFFSLSDLDPTKPLKKLGRGIEKTFKKIVELHNDFVKAVFNFHKDVLRGIGRAIAEVPGLSALVGAIVCNVNAACWAIYAKVMTGLNAAIGLVNGQSLVDVAKGAAIGYVAGGVGGQISGALGGTALGNALGEYGSNAVGAIAAGGLTAKALGGKFADGAKGTAVGLAVNYAATSLGARINQLGERSAGNTLGNSGPSGCNPINYATGEKYLTLSDLQPIGNSRLKFERYYASYDDDITSLGHGWRHTFDRKLEFTGMRDTPSRVVIKREKGESIAFNYIIGEGYQTLDTKGYLLVQSEPQNDVSTWQLSTPDNVTERYDAHGLLVSVEYLGGYQQHLSYEQDNRTRAGKTRRLLRVTDSMGYSLQFSHNEFGLLATVSNDAEQTLRFDYDSRDNLIAVYGAELKLRQRYVYNDDRFPHSITGMYNQLGQRIHYMAYDHRGRAVLSALGHQAGRDRMIFHERNGDGLLSSTVTNALGRKTTYTFDKNNNPIGVEGHATASCIAANQGYDYDEQGRVIAETDWNDVQTQYEYNNRGSEIARIQAVDTEQERTIITKWHQSLRLPVEIVEPGKKTRFEYNDARLLVKRIEIDTLSKRSVLAKLFNIYPTRIWLYGYNDQGLVTAIDGPIKGDADITRYTYSEKGLRTQVVNAMGHVAETLAFNQLGLPEKVVDPNGVITKLGYNERGWLTEKVVQTEKGPSVTQITYAGAKAYNGGGKSQSNEGLVDTITLPNGVRLSYEYDAAGRSTAMVNAHGERIEYAYDLAGNRVNETVRSDNGQIVRDQRRVYDELSRLLQSIGADNAITRYRYDANGNRTAHVDPLGHETTFKFDALNRLIKTTDAADGVIHQAWDEQDRLTSVTDQRGLTTEYRYNGFGDKIAQISPDTGITLYRHDRAGNIVAQTDSRGEVTRYRYDTVGRLIMVDYDDDAQDITYVYDQSDNERFDAEKLYQVGRLASVTDASGSTEYRYSAFGQVVEESKQLGGQRYHTAYEYDMAGNLLEARYPTGQVVSYERNELGRIARMEANGRTVVNQVQYDAFAGINQLHYGNGSELSIGRDTDGRITAMRLNHSSMQSSVAVHAANDRLYERAYQYDLNSNIVAIEDGVLPSASQRFGYDVLSRLTQAQGRYGQLAYIYDGVGNRVEKRSELTASRARPENSSTQLVERYRYAKDSNRLLGVNNRQLGYDAMGNIVNDHSQTAQKLLSYGSNNRLQRVELPEGFIEYVYNAKGQRVIKKEFGIVKAREEDLGPELLEETHFHYHDTQGHLIAETRSNGELVKDYLYLGTERLGVVDYALEVAIEDREGSHSDRHGELLFVHNDHLGAPQLMTDSDQTIVWQVDRKPFGEVDARIANLDMRAGFPGQYFEGISGYIYNYFRDYDPGLGRYIQSDPIGLVGGVNTFGYVGGNPITLIDLYGLYKCMNVEQAGNNRLAEMRSGYGSVIGGLERQTGLKFSVVSTSGETRYLGGGVLAINGEILNREYMIDGGDGYHRYSLDRVLIHEAHHATQPSTNALENVVGTYESATINFTNRELFSEPNRDSGYYRDRFRPVSGDDKISFY